MKNSVKSIKKISMLMLVVMLISSFVACSNQNETEKDSEEIQLVECFIPEYKIDPDVSEQFGNYATDEEDEIPLYYYTVKKDGIKLSAEKNEYEKLKNQLKNDLSDISQGYEDYFSKNDVTMSNDYTKYKVKIKESAYNDMWNDVYGTIRCPIYLAASVFHDSMKYQSFEGKTWDEIKFSFNFVDEKNRKIISYTKNDFEEISNVDDFDLIKKGKYYKTSLFNIKIVDVKITDKIRTHDSFLGIRGTEKAGRGKTFVDVIIELKNFSPELIRFNDDENDFLSFNGFMLYADKYEYRSSHIVWEDFEEFASLLSDDIYLDSLEKQKVHLLCELPKVIKNNNKSLKLVLEAFGKKFAFKIR